MTQQTGDSVVTSPGAEVTTREACGFCSNGVVAVGCFASDDCPHCDGTGYVQ